MNIFRVLIPSLIAIVSFSGCGGSSSNGTFTTGGGTTSGGGFTTGGGTTSGGSTSGGSTTGGGTTTGGGSQANPFAGRYVGPFTDPSGDKGVVYVNIGTNGAITGTGVDMTKAAASTFTGSITSAGAVTLSGAGGNFKSQSGTVSLSNNVLQGSLTGSTGSTTTVQLSSSALATVPNFFGALSGTYALGGAGSPGNGITTMLVDVNGNVTGVSVNSFNTAQTLTGTITSAGLLNFTSSGGNSYQGTLSINGNSVSGMLNGYVGSVLKLALTLS